MGRINPPRNTGRFPDGGDFFYRLVSAASTLYTAMNRRMPDMETPHSIETRYSLFRHPALDTHFQLTGPDSGDTVVLVPGATLPLAVWEPLAPSLVECGYRVIRYDLPGRGYSSAPGGGFDLTSF
jgi:pimeloyl-ACP methyl ester carboxylesterase